MNKLFFIIVSLVSTINTAYADVSYTFTFRGKSYSVSAVLDDVSKHNCDVHTKDWQTRIGTKKPTGSEAPTPSDLDKFVTNYPCRFVTEQIADQLHDYWESIEDVQDFDRINLIIRFVNSLPYELENRYVDYWKTPYETLQDGKGDCEDHAFLLAEIFRQVGLDSALIDMVGHVSVCVNPFSGEGITGGQAGLNGMYLNGNDFYAWCEATPSKTAECWNVGEKPEFYKDHEIVDTRLIPKHHVENVYKMWRNIFEPSYQGDTHYYGNLDYKDDFFNPDPKAFTKGNYFFNPPAGSK